MKLYRVYFWNGLPYEDSWKCDFLIGANSENDAIQSAKPLVEKFGFSSEDIEELFECADEITKTDNGIPIYLSE